MKYVILNLLLLFVFSPALAQSINDSMTPNEVLKAVTKNFMKSVDNLSQINERDLTEEEKEALIKIEEMLPVLEQAFGNYSDLLKKNPLYQPAINVLGRTFPKSMFHKKDIAESMDMIMELLIDDFIKRESIEVDINEIKEAAAKHQVPDESLFEQMEKKENDLFKLLQKESNSVEDQQKISEELERVAEAKKQIRSLLDTVGDGAETRLAFLLYEQKNRANEKANERILKAYGKGLLYKTNKGEEPILGYRNLLNEYISKGKIRFIDSKFEQAIRGYIKETIRSGPVNLTRN